MNPTGPRDTSESNTPHTEGERFGERWNTQQSNLPPDALTGELGEPAGDIEIVAVEMSAVPPAGLTDDEGELVELMELDETGGGGFRWWYVPAVLVPAAAGVATTLWLVNRRRQPALVTTYRGLTGRARGLWDDLRSPRTAKSAKKTVRRAMKSAESTATGLNDRAAAALAAIGAITLAGRAGNTMQGARARALALWRLNTPSTRATKRQAKTTAAQTAAALSGLRQSIIDWYAQLDPQERIALARSQAAARLMDATTPVMSAISTAGARTQGAVQSAGDSVGNTARAMRAFTFGAAVSAIATYLGLTRRRAGQPVTRETASGRQLPGYWPKFGNRTQQTAASGSGRR